MLIPAKAKEVNLAIKEPLIDQEKEEYYELQLHISTFVSEETQSEDTNRLQIKIIPPMTQREITQTEQQVTNLAEKSVSPAQQQEEGDELGDIESDNPEYEITKEKIKKLAKEISAVRKKATETKGKGKRKLILSDSEDEEELLATDVDIIEDVVANKVPVKTQFQKFVEAGAR